nr:prolipoprotein diacylglyceryl transferase [Blochmannia endosymbiont of Polyrhachis (Hedomyrma) turneri]
MLVNYLVFPYINPIIFSWGPISLHWYGAMYFFSFLFGILVLSNRANFIENCWIKKEIENLLYISFFALLIGGRIGYVIFYQPEMFYRNVLCIFKIWEGGMSFHGGLIGVIVVWILFSYYKNFPFFKISDFIVPIVPFGLAAGRLGNFINGELYGRVNIDIPWAMLFPNTQRQDILDILKHSEWEVIFDIYGALPRHPSQLYEMLLEGVLLFIIINYWLIRTSPPIGSISGLFLFLYGVFRIFVECFREPDLHIGLFMGYISMGQILSIPMVIAGIIILCVSYGIFCKKDFN